MNGNDEDGASDQCSGALHSPTGCPSNIQKLIKVRRSQKLLEHPV